VYELDAQLVAANIKSGLHLTTHHRACPVCNEQLASTAAVYRHIRREHYQSGLMDVVLMWIAVVCNATCKRDHCCGGCSHHYTTAGGLRDHRDSGCKEGARREREASLVAALLDLDNPSDNARARALSHVHARRRRGRRAKNIFEDFIDSVMLLTLMLWMAPRAIHGACGALPKMSSYVIIFYLLESYKSVIRKKMRIDLNFHMGYQATITSIGRTMSAAWRGNSASWLKTLRDIGYFLSEFS
jgi:hypothetical protein